MKERNGSGLGGGDEEEEGEGREDEIGYSCRLLVEIVGDRWWLLRHIKHVVGCCSVVTQAEDE